MPFLIHDWPHSNIFVRIYDRIGDRILDGVHDSIHNKILDGIDDRIHKRIMYVTMFFVILILAQSSLCH